MRETEFIDPIYISKAFDYSVVDVIYDLDRAPEKKSEFSYVTFKELCEAARQYSDYLDTRTLFITAKDATNLSNPFNSYFNTIFGTKNISSFEEPSIVLNINELL